MTRRTKTPESAVLSACLDLLKLRGVLAWRNATGGILRTSKDGRQFRAFYGLRGSADILGCLPGGRLLAVECKSAKGRLTVEQSHFLEQVELLGGLAVVARDVGDLIEALENAT